VTNRRYLTLIPTERQQVLRRLKHGPDLPREDLAEFACRVRREVLAERASGEAEEKAGAGEKVQR
jgi:hypothetical protein